ncbi:MAG TPA: GxxExxY protein, partial [Acidobacteriota bacterium]|nr:GxxExxY protein [Acidobacteriota bacterium]
GHENKRRSLWQMEYKLRVNTTLDPDLETLIQRVIGLAIDGHRNLGPGYIETIYEKALCYEFDKAGIRYLRQIEILVPYKDTMLSGQRLDLFVEKN